MCATWAALGHAANAALFIDDQPHFARMGLFLIEKMCLFLGSFLGARCTLTSIASNTANRSGCSTSTCSSDFPSDLSGGSYHHTVSSPNWRSAPTTRRVLRLTVALSTPNKSPNISVVRYKCNQTSVSTNWLCSSSLYLRPAPMARVRFSRCKRRYSFCSHKGTNCVYSCRNSAILIPVKFRNELGC